MKILGIDQSYTSSGFMVLEGDTVLHAEKYVSNKDTDKPARAWEIAKRINKIVEQFNPDIVAIEGLAFGMRGDATRDLAGLQFVIVCALREKHKKECIVVSPRTVKVTATGSGKADKMDMYTSLPPQVQTLVEEMGLKKSTGMLDLSDAYWIAKTVANPEFTSQGFDKPKKKRRVRKKKE
jgi:Holliday junction resolvasome RuvABC endonuclease subunit